MHSTYTQKDLKQVQDSHGPSSQKLGVPVRLWVLRRDFSICLQVAWSNLTYSTAHTFHGLITELAEDPGKRSFTVFKGIAPLKNSPC